MACFFQKFYPVNYMRNIAIASVQTKYVYITDVDVMPMPDMEGTLNRYFTKTPLMPKEVIKQQKGLDCVVLFAYM